MHVYMHVIIIVFIVYFPRFIALPFRLLFFCFSLPVPFPPFLPALLLLPGFV